MTDLSSNPFAGMTNWTGGQTTGGDRGAMQRQIDELKTLLIQHFNTDLWQSRLEYPHPNQRVSTLYFMDGNGRLYSGGIQFIQTSTSPPPTISVVSDQPTDTPETSYPNFLFAPNVYSGSLPNYFSLGVNAIGSEFFGLRGSSEGLVGPYPQIQLKTLTGAFSFRNDGVDPNQWVMSGGSFVWPTFTTGTQPDATHGDGATWYNTSTDRFRGVANGVVVDFAYSSDPIVLSNLDVPFNAYSVNQALSSSNCFVTMDASGANRTFTLPSAATLGSGFTYVFKKIDSSNNTVTIDPSSTQTVDGVQTYVLTKQYETLCATSDGTNWVIWSAYNNNFYVATTATSVTVGPRDTFLGMSTASGNVTANLPTAVGIAGREITLKKTTSDTNTLTVDPNSTQTIDGVTTYVLTSPGEITICSDGANWLIKNTSFDGFRATTTTATTTAADRTVSANASGGAYSVTLVTAVGNAGLTQTLKKIGTDYNVVTIDGNSAETIDGVLTLGLSSPNQYFTLTSDGAGWLITGAGL